MQHTGCEEWECAEKYQHNPHRDYQHVGGAFVGGAFGFVKTDQQQQPYTEGEKSRYEDGGPSVIGEMQCRYKAAENQQTFHYQSDAKESEYVFKVLRISVVYVSYEN